MDMTKYFFRYCMALLFSAPVFATPHFTIHTDTPELTVNQSSLPRQVPVQFKITNHLGSSSGPITVSHLQTGIVPNILSDLETDCDVLSVDIQSFQIAGLNAGKACTLNLLVSSTLLLTDTHIVISPKVCTQDHRCSESTKPIEHINLYAIKGFQKVVMILFENEDADVALSFPMFKFIADNGVYFKDFHAVTRPSQPNYFAMIAGDTFGVITNGIENINKTTIVDILETTGRTWKTYAENYPTVDVGLPDWENGCYIAAASADNQYRRKHNPFMSFTTITSNPARCANIVNAQDHFQNDLLSGNLPDYSFFIPNLVDSGHDLGLGASDTWIETYLFPLMESQQAKDEEILFVLMFDESYPKGTPDEVANNLIYAAFYGPMVDSHQIVNHPYTFYNLLRSIEDIWQLGTLGRHDSTAFPITPTVWQR